MCTDVKPENILVSLGSYPDNEPNIDFILADMSVSMSYSHFNEGRYAGYSCDVCLFHGPSYLMLNRNQKLVFSGNDRRVLAECAQDAIQGMRRWIRIGIGRHAFV